MTLAFACLAFVGAGVGRAETFSEAAFLALNKDPRISAAISSAQAEEARVAQLRTTGRPQVSGTLTTESSNGGQSSDTNLAQLEISQEIFSFGTLSSSLDAAEAQVALAWIEVTQTNQDVFADTSLAYANVLQADELVQLRENFSQELDERQRVVEVRIEAGLASLIELQSLARRRAEAQVELLLAEQESITARLDLERLTGVYIREVSFEGLSRRLSLMPESLERSQFLAELSSPESQISEQRFRIVEAQVRADDLANTPSLELFGTYDYGERNGLDVNDQQAGLRLSVPVFQGGLRGAVEREGVQTRQEALRLRQQDQLLIAQSAAASWVQVDIAQRAAAVWVRTQAIQTQQLAAVQNEVNADLATVDDLLEVRAQLVDTQAEVIRARYDVLRTQLALLRTVGLASPLTE